MKTRGGFAELIFTPGGVRGVWYGVVLFNWVDHEDDALDYRSLSAHLGLLIRRNIRLVGEYTYIFKSNYGEHGRAGIGLIAAF